MADILQSNATPAPPEAPDQLSSQTTNDEPTAQQQAASAAVPAPPVAPTTAATSSPGAIPESNEQLPSEIGGGPDGTQELLEAAVEAAASDSQLLLSEISQGIVAVVEQFQDAGLFPETAQQNYLESVVPISESLTKALEEAIDNVKESTPQGMLLSQQLQAGSITQEQFDAAIDAIVVPSNQLLSNISQDVVSQVQAALQALLNSSQLNTLAKLTTTKPGSTPATQAAVPPAAGQSDGVPVAQVDVLPPGEETVPDPSAVSSPAQLTSAFTDAPAGLPGIAGEFTGVAPQETLASAAAPAEIKTLTQFVVADEEALGFFEALIAQAAKIAAQNLKASAASLLTLRPQPRIMNGARAVIKINGKVAALCTECSYEINMDWSEIRGVDELIPNDLAPMAFSVKGSMRLYRVPNRSPIGEFIHADMFRGVIWPYTTIEIRDKRTDELIMLIQRAAITSRSESFAKGQLTTTNMSFIGIGFRDEMMPELLPDKLTNDSEDGTGGLLDTLASILPF